MHKVVLGDKINILPGYPFNSKFFTDEPGMPLIRIRDLSTHDSDTNYIGSYNALYVVRKNDVLIGMDGDFNIIKWKGINSLLNQRILKIYQKHNSDVDINYIFYRLQPILLEINSRTAATTVKHLSTYDISELELPIHSLPQQHHIAAILSTLDAQLEKTEAIIAKYQAIKQGMLHDLFTRGIDLQTGQLRPAYADAPQLYKPSEMGMIPKVWEVIKLGSITEKVGSGVTPKGGSEVYLSQGVLFIRSQNVLENELSLHDAVFIPQNIDDNMSASRVQLFDVLLNITGASIGRCAYYPHEFLNANVNQHVCIIRFIDNKSLMAIFASAFLNSSFGQSQINRLNAGGNREGLNYSQIRSFFFPLINPVELACINDKINGQNSVIKKEMQVLGKLTLLKNGLMSDLLSGKVEVSADEKNLMLIN